MIKQTIQRMFRSIGYEIRRYPSKRKPYVPFTKNPQKVKDWEERLKTSPVKLNIGCGPRILKGWINIDLWYTHFAEYLQYYTDVHYPESMRGTESDFFAFDVTSAPLPISDNTVDLIFHEDFIEHIDQKSQFLFLAETWRILKPEGIHRVNTPNLTISMRDHSDFSTGFNGVFVEEWNKHVHLNVLTRTMLEEMASMIGYSKIVFTGKNESQSNLVPLEYRPNPQNRSEDGNLFADLYK